MATNGNLGTVYYKVEADTDDLLKSQPRVKKAVDSVSKSMDGMDSSSRRASKGVKDLGNSGRDASNKLRALPQAIQSMGKSASVAMPIIARAGPLLAGIASVKTAQQIINIADAWTEMQNRLRLVTKSQEELNTSTEAIYQIAQRTSQSIDPVAEVFQRFAQNADSLGISLGEVATITDTVAKAVAISGASASAAQAALTQFGQALASGTLRGEELNSVMEQTPGLAMAIATGLGVPIGQLRVLAADGKITSEQLIIALKNAAKYVDEQFGTRVKTAGQAWQEMTNTITKFIGEANNATGFTAALANAITWVAQSIDSIDLSGFSQGMTAIKATIEMIIDGLNSMMTEYQKSIGGITTDLSGATTDVFREFFGMVEKDSAESAKRMNSSFGEMALSTAKEVDELAKFFTGAVGAIQGAWDALTTNIPNLFKTAWAMVKKDAADLVNSVSGMINKIIVPLGASAIGGVDWGGGSGPAQMINIADAAAKGWKEASKSLGAYDKMVDRLSRGAIDQAAVDTLNEYNAGLKETAKVTAAATKDKKGKGKKGGGGPSEEAKAYAENAKVIAAMRRELELLKMTEEEMAKGQATDKLNKYATPQDVETVRQLAAEIKALEEFKKLQKKVGDDAVGYVRGNDAPLSGGAFDEQTARYEAEKEVENKRYADQLIRLREAMEARKLTQEQYYTEFEMMNQKHQDRMQQIEDAKNDVMLTKAADGFGQMADDLTAFAQTFGAENARMFKVAKAAAIAQTIIQTYQSAQAAFSAMAGIPIVGPALGAVAAGAAVAGGMARVATIRSQSAGGRQYGGPVDASKMYRVNENGAPEMLKAANGQQYLLPNTRGQVVSNSDATGSTSSGGMPGVLVQVIENPSRGGQQEESIDEFGRRVARVFVTQIQNGGPIAQAGEGTYNWKRQGI